MAEVTVRHPAGVAHAASFYELEDARIRRATEYWVEARSERPPEWRARWTERMENG